MNGKSEQLAVEAVVRDYLDGMIYGQPDLLENAMHPLCMQAGHFNSVYEFFGRNEFIESLADAEKLDPGSPYNFKIVSVDITGDVAVAKVEDDCLGTSFTDYLTLIKHDGRWQIVMKAFFDHANSVD